MSELNNNVPMRITQLEEATAYEEGMFYAIAKAGGRTKKIAQDVPNKAFDRIVEEWDSLDLFLYKKNTYINNSGVETALSGYDLYKIPVKSGDFFGFKQTSGTENFYGALNNQYVLKLLNNGSYENVTANGTGSHTYYYFYDTAITNKQFEIFVSGNITAVLISVKQGNENLIKFFKNSANQKLIDKNKVDIKNTVVTLNENNSFKSNFYRNTSGIQVLLTTGYFVLTYEVKEGDKYKINAKATGISYWGWFTAKDDITSSEIPTSEYTIPEDGFINAFFREGENIRVEIYPKDSIQIDFVNIKNVPTSDNPYIGLSAVSFGTSLTYRAQTTGGYLQFLPDLSGMTFDNQGVGSSYIYGASGSLNMLEKVKAYTSYSNKNVVTLEGFVNDWYEEHTLGSYTDTEENSVCGCVRSALNYIRAQNSSATVFLILDHYGKTGSADCSSTAVRGGKTQFEYYEEIAKVAHSLSVRVIKLYEDSEMSEANYNSKQALINKLMKEDDISTKFACNQAIGQ